MDNTNRDNIEIEDINEQLNSNNKVIRVEIWALIGQLAVTFITIKYVVLPLISLLIVAFR